MEPWPAPWYPISDPRDAARLEAQLQRELASGHRLHGLEGRAIARRHDRDDVLFELVDPAGSVAEVHLTWAGRQPPPFPMARVFSSRSEWDRLPRDERWSDFS